LDDEIALAIQDQDYHTGMVEYGMKGANLMDPIWGWGRYPFAPVPSRFNNSLSGQKGNVPVLVDWRLRYRFFFSSK
jgi:hypothetical protein